MTECFQKYPTIPSGAGVKLFSKFGVFEDLCLNRNGAVGAKLLRRFLYKALRSPFETEYRRQAEIRCSASKWDTVVWGYKKGLASIVLPVYNQAQYLEESIESVLAQSYQDVELIVVNDGSTDGVERIFNQYVGHPRILFLSQENHGLPAALNTGFYYAQGEYFTWTSADNIMSHDHIEAQVRFLQRHRCFQMVYCNYSAIDDEGKPYTRKGLTLPGTNVVRTKKDICSLGYTYNFIAGCFMYRSYVARIIGNYDVETFGAEDYDYWLRIEGDFGIQHIGDMRSYYQYRIHDNTIRGREGNRRIAETIAGVQQLNSMRRAFLREPMLLLLPEDAFRRFGNDNPTDRARVYELLPYKDSDALDGLLERFEKARKVVVFVVGGGENNEKYPAVIAKQRANKRIFTYKIIERDEQILDEDVFDFFILQSESFPGSEEELTEKRYVRVSDWSLYLKLWAVVANHRLFAKSTKKTLFGLPPEHIKYLRHEP